MSRASDADALSRARETFQRGVQATERRDYVTAAKRFREALAIHYAPAVAYNLAAALYELKQYPEAYNHVQGVLAAPELPEGLRPRAEALEQSLQLEVARLTVVTGGASGLSAHVDGQPLASELVGRPQAVTPGPHEVAAIRGGEVVSRRTVDIALRTTAIVDVSLIVTQDAAQAEPALAALSAPNPRDDTQHSKRRKILWISVAAGVAVVGAGVAVALLLRDDDGGHSKPVAGDSGVLTW